ncbi:hypothetical protein BZG36_04145 [Bifiguratus adelaidae]|uniref:mRNA cap guanine-N(7) methyltransferase n=1 Tax=Bifiguratus adelaidae TaxID=1938954 RepID=A0A261XZG7_9FUNG|nr:hypothetical protein BZG36_04145 [Bifiguratus adelaidae]
MEAMKRAASPSSDAANKRRYHSQDDTEARAVAEHYNARPEVGREKRKESKIIRLKSFNNWIKSVLIGRYIARGDYVLDMGCGKGGDLLKMVKARIAELVGADIASISIEQAQDRYNGLRNPPFRARFLALDCYSYPLAPHLPDSYTVDVVTMQFCMHYAFETEEKARMMLQNVSHTLRDGGYFIGTIPNANWIVKKVRDQKSRGQETAFGNDIYWITFEEEDTKEFPSYGAKYMFHLEDAVDCPEYLVHFPTFTSLAKEYNLELEYKQTFHQLYQEAAQESHFNNLLYRMNVVGGHGQALSEAEWEAAGLYLAFAFRKRRP